MSGAPACSQRCCRWLVVLVCLHRREQSVPIVRYHSLSATEKIADLLPSRPAGAVADGHTKLNGIYRG